VGDGGVSFSMSHNPGVAHGQLQVVVDGVAVGTFTHSAANSAADMKWETHSVTFPVSGPTTQLCFRAALTSAGSDYPVIDAVSLGAPPVFLGQFGGPGTGSGTFNTPQGVLIDPRNSNVYIADANNDLVQAFTPAGVFGGQVGHTHPVGLAYDPSSGVLVVAPFGDAVNQATHDIYAAFYNNDAVLIEANGAEKAVFGGTGTGNGQFNGPTGVAVDPISGDVYVADTNNQRVERFDANGAYLSQFAERYPSGLATDPTGNVYVADKLSGTVNVFSPAGTFLFGVGAFGDQLSGQPSELFGVAVDPATGVLYVVDGVHDNVTFFGRAPTVSGSTLDGGTVYASRPSQVGRGPFTYTYQWLDCPPGGGACVTNGPATSSSGLRLKPSDEGQTIEVAVTQTSPAGTVGPITSVAVGPVLPSPPVNQAPPVVSGPTADGSVVTASHGTWSGAPATTYAYQWQSCSGGTCANVGTNASAYRLAPGDVGHTIRVQVSATNPDGSAGPVASAEVGPVTASPPVNTTAPSITGAYAAGSRLTGQAGTWTGVLPIGYAYQWQRCPDGTPATCVDIPGATLNNYRLTPADTHVRLVVSATNADGGPVTATSPIAP
jgi:DNA-binding beta-propeller fold protein YncE